MSAAVAFFGVVLGLVVWGLLVRRLTGRPWETPGALESEPGDISGPDGRALSPLGIPALTARSSPTARLGFAPARIGLRVFLAVISSLFGLFISAYYMRMEHSHGDWSPVVLPRILWLNTVMLILGSGGMQVARSAVRRARMERVKIGLLGGGLFTLAFLVGQLWAWHQLNESGYLLASPAVAFFYLLTAVHGLHLLGGLLVWGRTVVRMMPAGVEAIDLRSSVELCTVYWHYLLVVWLILFAVLL